MWAHESGAAGDGLDVQRVPSASALENAGQRMQQAVDGVFDAVVAANLTWSGLPSVFWVSGAETVDSALIGPELSTAFFQENVHRGRRALDLLAAGYEVLERRRQMLVERAVEVRARLVTAEAESESSQATTEFGMVAAADLLDARTAVTELRADIAQFHSDLTAEEEAFAADLARVPVEDAITATDGTLFTDRLAEWAVSGEPGSSVDALDRRLAESVTDRLSWMLSASEPDVQHWLDENPEFDTVVEFAEPSVVSQW